MTQDEIIEMAKQTHLPYFWETGVPCNLSGLEAFAKLVAAKEREEFSVHAVDIARRAIKEEREACAKVAERRFLAKPSCTAEETYELLKKSIAADIRARGEA